MFLFTETHKAYTFYGIEDSSMEEKRALLYTQIPSGALLYIEDFLGAFLVEKKAFFEKKHLQKAFFELTHSEGLLYIEVVLKTSRGSLL